MHALTESLALAMPATEHSQLHPNIWCNRKTHARISYAHTERVQYRYIHL